MNNTIIGAGAAAIIAAAAAVGIGITQPAEMAPTEEAAVSQASSTPTAAASSAAPVPAVAKEAPPNAHTWASTWESRDKSLAPTNVPSFGTAKKRIMGVYESNPEQMKTIYCGCEFTANKKVSHAGCGYTPRKESKRSASVEWEHMVPASRFGDFRACWSTGDDQCETRKGKAYKGRKCCEKGGVAPSFHTMVSDLHNLVPSIGEVNLRRSNHPYGETAETEDYGGCDFDLVSKVAEPTDAVRGDVARAWLYMEQVYGMPLSVKERAMFDAWHKADPPDAWEKKRNQLIEELQGNLNPLIH